MSSRLHFIAGLPRSGSTLIAAILRQNPAIHATMSSPVAEVVRAVLRATNDPQEFAMFVSDHQRKAMVRSVIDAYYQSIGSPLVFDTNRTWCGMLGILAELFPAARVVCCVRSPAWIMDSTERFIQRDPFKSSRLFNYDLSMTVYDRIQAMNRGAYLGAALNSLRQAWFGEHANKLVVIRYDSLVGRPNEVMRGLYEVLGEPYYDHDFENVEYQEPEFDRFLGLPGFHTVIQKVEPRHRETCLPAELFQQNVRCFWDDDGNPRNVTVL